MTPGEIYFLRTNPMFALQRDDLWMKITNSPVSKTNARPFLFLRDGHDDNWGFFAPLKSKAKYIKDIIHIPAVNITYINGSPRDQFLAYKQIWEIPKVFIYKYGDIKFSQGKHHYVDRNYLDVKILPQCDCFINLILSSY